MMMVFVCFFLGGGVDIEDLVYDIEVVGGVDDWDEVE